MKSSMKKSEENPQVEKLLYNCQQTAAMLSVSRQTLWRWVCAGKISFVLLGKNPRFTKEDIQNFIESQRVRISPFKKIS
ncbi:MAG: helix-turn-helix domain-containing protein [Acidobacteriota bacterium]